MIQKIYSKMQLVSCTNTHHDVIEFVDLRMVKHTKTWISWQWNINFFWNKEILNLCLRWHILSSYRFVAEVIFNNVIYLLVMSKNFAILFFDILLILVSYIPVASNSVFVFFHRPNEIRYITISLAIFRYFTKNYSLILLVKIFSSGI